MKKKLILLFFSVIIISFIVNAQFPKNKKDSDIRFGVRLGFGVASPSENGPYFGLNTGVFAGIPVSSSFTIQPELVYAQLGIRKILLGGNTNARTVLDYLTIPILAKYNFNKSGFSVLAGTQYGFLLSAKDKINNHITDIKSKVSSGDVAAIFGAEYFFKIGVGIAVRYQFGFSNIPKPNYENIVNAKNKAILFSVAYRF
jgi:hypothetical protein